MRRQSTSRRPRSRILALPPISHASPRPAKTGLAPPTRNQTMFGNAHTDESDNRIGLQKDKPIQGKKAERPIEVGKKPLPQVEEPAARLTHGGTRQRLYPPRKWKVLVGAEMIAGLHMGGQTKSAERPEFQKGSRRRVAADAVSRDWRCSIAETAPLKADRPPPPSGQRTATGLHAAQ